MKLAYAVLCDFACPGAGNKPTVVGIFDTYFGPRPAPGEQMVTPVCFIHARINAPGNAGFVHQFASKLLNPDGGVIFEHEDHISFVPRGDGLGLFANLYIHVGRIVVPDFGNYEWALYVDGDRIGELPLSLMDAATLSPTMLGL